jgi:hypothetical protein
MESIVFWVVTHFGSAECYQLFRGTCCPYLQGQLMKRNAAVGWLMGDGGVLNGGANRLKGKEARDMLSGSKENRIVLVECRLLGCGAV